MYQTRSIRFIGREDLGDWRLKVYGIGTHAPDARSEFVAATLEAARTVLPEGGGAGFVIAHDAKTAGLALIHWWANENEIHGRYFALPLDKPAALHLRPSFCSRNAVPARSRRVVHNRGSSDEAEGLVRRRPLLGLGLALILSAAAGGCGHEDEEPAVRVIDLPGASLSVAVGEGAVWVANFDDDTVLRVDPRSMKILAEIPVGRDPFSVATGEGAVWVVDRHGTTTRVDPRSNRPVEKALVKGRLMAVAVGEGSVWAFETRVGQLLRIDPRTNTLLSTSNKIVQRGPATSDYAGVAVGAGSVWVVSPGEGRVVRMDPRSNRPVATIRVGGGPAAVAVAGNTVWVANFDDGTVTRIDARTNQVVGKPVSVGGRPVAVAVGGGAVWVASGTGGVTRLDPESGTPVGDPIPVPGRLQGLAFGEGAAWVVDQDAPALTRIEP